MKASTDYYFFVKNLTYSQDELIEIFQTLEKNWICYGSRSKKTLWALPLDLNTFSKTKLGESIPMHLVESVAYFMTRKGGEVLPHSDTRPTSFLIPVLGNFVDSRLEFFDTYIDKTVSHIDQTNDNFASSTITYQVGEPSCVVSYTEPIIINSRVIHSVKNPTDDHRIVLSITMNSSLSYQDLLKIFSIKNAGMSGSP
jgi:hypothetical protein